MSTSGAPTAAAGPVVTLIACTFEVEEVGGVVVVVELAPPHPETSVLKRVAKEAITMPVVNLRASALLIEFLRPGRLQVPSEGRRLSQKTTARARPFARRGPPVER